MKIKLKRIGIAMAAVILATPALAEKSTLTISDQVLRMTIPSRPAAGYFKLTNSGDKPRMLVGASSNVCGKTMLHESKMENGSMKMVHVESLVVPPGGSVVFARGGYHVMCMKPDASLKPGETAMITLMFGNGEKLEAEFPVKGAR